MFKTNQSPKSLVSLKTVVLPDNVKAFTVFTGIIIECCTFMKIKSLIFCHLFPLFLFASVHDTLKKDLVITARPYSVLLFSAGYRLPAYTGSISNSGRGVFLEAGVNAGRLISKNVLVGIFVGWGWKDNLWYSGFNNGFVKDYATSIDHEKPASFLDSSVVAASSGLFAAKKGRSLSMPGCEMSSFHNYSLYYGLVVRLPLRFFPVVKLYRGSTRSHYQGPDGLVTSGNDYNILQLRRSLYGCELMTLNPLRLFYKNTVPQHLQHIGVSVYYEYCDFYTSALYFDNSQDRRLIPLRTFVSAGLLKKYAHENLFGFKLSYNLYYAKN